MEQMNSHECWQARGRLRDYYCEVQLQHVRVTQTCPINIILREYAYDLLICSYHFNHFVLRFRTNKYFVLSLAAR